MKTLRFCFLLFGLGFAGGWWFGRDPNPEVEFPETLRSPPSRAARPLVSPAHLGLSSDVAALLNAVHAAPSAAERLRAVIQLASEIPITEIRRWRDQPSLGRLTSVELGVFRDITSRRWLQEDPEGLIEHCQLRKSTDFYEITARFARVEPDRAFALLDVPRDPLMHRLLREALLVPLSEYRPDQVIAWINRSPDHLRYSQNVIFLKLAEHHPDKLAAATAGWSAPIRRSAETALTTQELRRDFSTALGCLLDSPGGRILWSDIVNSHQFFSYLDEGSIFNHVHRLPPEWIEDLIGGGPEFIRKDPARWLRVDVDALGIEPEKAAQLREFALNHLATESPELALAHLENMDLSAYRWPFAKAVLALADTDPDAARRWAEQAPDGDDRFQEYLKGQLDEKLQPAPTAESLIASVSPNAGGVFNPSDITMNLPLVEFSEQQKFLQAFKNLPPDQRAAANAALVRQSYFLNRIPPRFAAEIISFAANHPDENKTGRFENEGLPDPFFKNISNFAARWTLEDPSAATRWVANLPPGETRQNLIRTMVDHWRNYDAPAANAWIATLSSSEQTDIRQHMENPR